MFKLARTYSDPQGSQSGFPSPGEGAQTTGDPSFVSRDRHATHRDPVRPTQGFRSWLFPQANDGRQRGFPEPEAVIQERPAGSMPNDPPISGMAEMVYTPYYDRGAAAYVPNFGKVLTNPIGAGVVALYRPQASYGGAAQYFNGALWWTNQVVPTSVNLQGLTSPDELAALLSQVEVEAVVRTTG